MNISEKIQLLTQDASVVETAKADIKQAIIDKGVDLTNIPFTDYHTKIAEITGGEVIPLSIGADVGAYDSLGRCRVRWYDFDCNLVKVEYVEKDTYIDLSTNNIVPDVIPATDESPVLTFIRWNFTTATEYLLESPLDIGALYTTATGYTYIYIFVISTCEIQLKKNVGASGSIKIEWGDGTETFVTKTTVTLYTHTYESSGDYTITISHTSENVKMSLWGRGASNAYPFIGVNATYAIYGGTALTGLGGRTFSGLRTLKKLSLPYFASSFPTSAGISLNALTHLTLPYLASVSGGNFSEMYNMKKLILASTGGTMPDTAIQSLVVPKGGTIRNEASYANSKCLREVVFMPGRTDIGGKAFKDCSALRDVYLPEGLISLGDQFYYETFRSCHSLAEIILPETLEYIGAYTFASCISLTKITIPSAVTTIGNSAFNACSNLSRVVMQPIVPPTLGDIYVFNNISSSYKIYVPDASVEAYKNATNWNNYAAKIYPISEM